MNKVTILILILISLLMLAGCSKDESDDINPVAPVSYDISLNELPEMVVAIDGATRSVAFTLQVTTTDGLLASGKQVQLDVVTGPGVIEPVAVFTNQYGLAQAVYTVVMQPGQRVAILEASLNGSASSSQVRLIGLNRPTSLELETENPTVIARFDDNVEMLVTATILDESGRGVSGVNLEFSLHPTPPDSIFGSLSRSASTDANGRVEIRFRSLGGFGRQVIHCNVDEPDGYLSEIEDELTIEVISLDEKIGYFLVGANPVQINVTSVKPETVAVDISVRDNNNVAMQDVSVSVVSDYGMINESGITDAFGNLRVFNVFHYDRIPDSTVQSVIYGSIPGTDWRASATVTVIPEAQGQVRLALTTDRRTIYADNGLTYATLTALLRDQNDRAISGQQIQFSSNFGVAQSPAVTDENGVAHSIFSDLGYPSVDENGMPDSVVVTAISLALGVENSVRIMISPWTEVSELEVRLSVDEIEAGSGDSLEIDAICYLSRGVRAGSGILVYFEAIDGRIFPGVEITGGGVATSFYYPTFTAGTDTLRVWVRNVDATIVTTSLIHVLPGQPARMVISADPDTLVANNPASRSEISTVISDWNSNFASAGHEVSFSTTLGSITEAAYTNDTGIARAYLTAGAETGNAIITASVQGEDGPIIARTTVTLVRPNVDSITLWADPERLMVFYGRAQLRATVRDENGSLVSGQVPVVFEILDDLPPTEGCYFGFQEQTYLALTENGVAAAELTAGTSSGEKLIRAYTWRDLAHQDTIVDLVTINLISSGAFRLALDYSTAAEDAGGGAWSLEFWLEAWDFYNNPVEDQIPVTFWVEPEIATISPGSIGNQNRAGEALPGTAFTQLTYQSARTFEPLEVGAFIQTERGAVEDVLDIILPLQEGALLPNVSPGNWHFDEDREFASIRIWVHLRDGHQARINYGPIIFSASRGDLFWYNTRDEEYERFEGQSRRLTGLNDLENEEEPGQATVFLRVDEDDIFINPESNEEIVTVTARVERYDDVERVEIEIVFTRGD